MRNVVVFGAFDGLHPGHISFLTQARNLGSRLIVILAQDDIIHELKGSLPTNDFDSRKEALEKISEVGLVIAGDHELSKYSSLAHANANVVAFGYDQQELKADVKKWLKGKKLNIAIVTLEPYQADKYKSSILNNS